jgi:ABC-type multidrug transport system fused ATPase/permease subunit
MRYKQQSVSITTIITIFIAIFFIALSPFLTKYIIEKSFNDSNLNTDWISYFGSIFSTVISLIIAASTILYNYKAYQKNKAYDLGKNVIELIFKNKIFRLPALERTFFDGLKDIVFSKEFQYFKKKDQILINNLYDEIDIMNDIKKSLWINICNHKKDEYEIDENIIYEYLLDENRYLLYNKHTKEIDYFDLREIVNIVEILKPTLPEIKNRLSTDLIKLKSKVHVTNEIITKIKKSFGIIIDK